MTVLLKQIKDDILDFNFRAVKVALLDLAKGIRISKDGIFIGRRPDINFIAAGGVTITVTENNAENRIDVTIST